MHSAFQCLGVQPTGYFEPFENRLVSGHNSDILNVSPNLNSSATATVTMTMGTNGIGNTTSTGGSTATTGPSDPTMLSVPLSEVTILPNQRSDTSLVTSMMAELCKVTTDDQ